MIYLRLLAGREPPAITVDAGLVHVALMPVRVTDAPHVSVERQDLDWRELVELVRHKHVADRHLVAIAIVESYPSENPGTNHVPLPVLKRGILGMVNVGVIEFEHIQIGELITPIAPYRPLIERLIIICGLRPLII